MTHPDNKAADWDNVWQTAHYVSDYCLRLYDFLRKLSRTLPPDASVLECGSGPGGGLAQFASHKAYGIDISTKAVYDAKAAGLEVIYGNILQIPFESNAFDLVYNSGVLEHFTQPEDPFGEMVRVTKKGGQILVIVPNSLCLSFRAYKLFKRVSGTWPFGYEEFYTPWRLTRLYEDAGVRIDSLFGLMALPPLASRKRQFAPLAFRKSLTKLEALFPLKTYYAYAVGVLGTRVD